MLNVVKYDISTDNLVCKYDSESIKLGSQLIVYPSQTAFFVKGGSILDHFTSGTYTLKSENIPLLGKLINIPFGNETPFKAEVWFVNQISILDRKWGTATPIQIEDPKYNIIIPIRGFGQYGFRINEPRVFLEAFVGNMTSFSVEKLSDYFRGVIMSQLTNVISDKLTRDNISVLTINSHLNDISIYCQDKLNSVFSKYGVEIKDFCIISISVVENDPSFAKLKEAKDFAARLKITGRDAYQMERSFDVLETAAGNESGGGNLINAGLGLGVGVNVGQQIGGMAANVINTNPSVPPPPPPAQYYLVVNGQQSGPYAFDAISDSIKNNQIAAHTLIWKQGMSNWEAINSLQEFASLFGTQLPPIPPIP
ncbi:membrane protease subunit (stomatin/prohibitin family) [Parabacteroides sp. PFB2-12]|uniref:SPFH domain-containing protein n=1 Tax=unclassified Parabacteroides TaxID=2649774 RepID=UPI002474FEFA|nr:MULTISPECIES: SPFH domain-containing protein [unclassified Parabacteroides]MDH6343435.1 membrane protease subunit (stomatin/prohibitin family) [Parabacteroides sp. PM6-13]MDH6391973.1 membrane protease subunit (stomatin/prohibitin family) [Parabacteroides sp. PFB2-12]